MIFNSLSYRNQVVNPALERVVFHGPKSKVGCAPQPGKRWIIATLLEDLLPARARLVLEAILPWKKNMLNCDETQPTICSWWNGNLLLMKSPRGPQKVFFRNIQSPDSCRAGYFRPISCESARQSELVSRCDLDQSDILVIAICWAEIHCWKPYLPKIHLGGPSQFSCNKEAISNNDFWLQRIELKVKIFPTLQYFANLWIWGTRIGEPTQNLSWQIF